MTAPKEVATAIRVLNEAIAADAGAVARLFAMRTPVNEALEEHPTIQVGSVSAAGANDDGPATLGVLGLINGLFGVDAAGWGHITAVYDYADDGTFRVVRFEETKR